MVIGLPTYSFQLAWDYSQIPVDHRLPVTDNYIPFENQLLGPAEIGVFIHGTPMTATRAARHELGSDRLTKS